MPGFTRHPDLMAHVTVDSPAKKAAVNSTLQASNGVVLFQHAQLKIIGDKTKQVLHQV
jgi:hypothetical protein